ncbi:RecB family exonuclease [Nocardia sp. IFM 10818]
MSVPAITTPDDAGDVGPAAPEKARRLALSPSRAIDFKQCPLKYRLRAIDRIPEPPSRMAVRGTLVHAVLEALFGLPAGERDLEHAAELIEPSWARLLEQRPEAGELVTGEDLAAFLGEVRELVGVYFGLEDPRAVEPESLEALIETESPDGVPLRGFVDRIDRSATGEVRIVDYKTGRAPTPAYETRALFQLKFYALVLLRTLGKAPDQLRLMYLADAQVLTYEPDADELLRFERIVTALWEAIRTAVTTKDFPPSRSWLCDYCEFKPLCPEFGGTPPPFPEQLPEFDPELP